MRVLVVTNMYPSQEQPALGRFVRDQVEALREIDDVEVELFAFGGGGPAPYARAARELRARFRKERFDVIHAHYGLTGWPALTLACAGRRRRGGRTPLVLTFHGTDLGHPQVGRLSRALAPLLTLPATVSATLARTSLPGAGRTRRVAVLPCGVDLDRFTPGDRGEARARLGLRDEGRYVLLPADPRRPEKRADRARALAEAAGATLLTYDATHPDHVPDHIRAADAVLVTSEREGFGLATLEALACDVPVLATDVGVAPLALAGISGTLCAPFDVDRWLEALRPHLDAGDPRVQGRARAALFDRRRMARRVAAAYRDVAPAG